MNKIELIIDNIKLSAIENETKYKYKTLIEIENNLTQEKKVRKISQKIDNEKKLLLFYSSYIKRYVDLSIFTQEEYMAIHYYLNDEKDVVKYEDAIKMYNDYDKTFFDNIDLKRHYKNIINIVYS